MGSSQSEIRKIVWAVDALDSDSSIQSHTADCLKALTRGADCSIEPVFVHRPPSLLRGGKGVHVLYSEEDRETIKKELNNWLATLNMPGLVPVRILSATNPSTRMAAQLLSQYAADSNADLVVVSTHGRSGLARSFLGSFAETLILTSTVPVFAANPYFTLKDEYKSILFPTDFEERDPFEKVVALAKNLDAHITVYTKIDSESSLTVSPIFVRSEDPQARIDDSLKLAQKRYQEFKKYADSSQVKSDLVPDSTRNGTSEAIVTFARDKKYDVIAMSSQSGPIASVLLGSVSRRILRDSPCPVWLIHTQGETQR